MKRRAAAVSKNTFYIFLKQLTPAARVGLIVFLLALAMLAAGLGVRSVTRHIAPFDTSKPPLMVQTPLNWGTASSEWDLGKRL